MARSIELVMLDLGHNAHAQQVSEKRAQNESSGFRRKQSKIGLLARLWLIRFLQEKLSAPSGRESARFAFRFQILSNVELDRGAVLQTGLTFL